jgi:hypothetical protein
MMTPSAVASLTQRNAVGSTSRTNMCSVAGTAAFGGAVAIEDHARIDGEAAPVQCRAIALSRSVG